MKNRFLVLLPIVILFSCSKPNEKTEFETNSGIGLMIIDAQKWYIPGHEESLYTLWNIQGNTSRAEQVIPAMDSVLNWANNLNLPVIITYEASDTGRYDLPDEILSSIDSSTTQHYVKFFYGAPKHKELDDMIEKTGIKKWIVIGAESDVCVYQTTKELLNKGNQVALVQEAVYSGRNNTEVSLSNLKKYGANLISIQDLNNLNNLFPSSKSNVPVELDTNNVVVQLFPFDEPDSSADLARYNYLQEYAKLINLPLVIGDSLPSKYSDLTILAAGNISKQKATKLHKQTGGKITFAIDCIPNLNYSELPESFEQTTLAIFFYELMKTVEFYTKSVEELSGWQKDLKNALQNGDLDYVESTRNLD